LRVVSMTLCLSMLVGSGIFDASVRAEEMEDNPVETLSTSMFRQSIRRKRVHVAVLKVGHFLEMVS